MLSSTLTAARVLVAVVVALAGTFLTVLVEPAEAATPASCGYGTGGAQDRAICWFDLAGYDDAVARTSAGQYLSFALGAYLVSVNVNSSGDRAVVADPVPVAPGILGTNGYYAGIPGRPALHLSGGGNDSSNTLTLRNLTITLDGRPVSGATLVAADAETVSAAGSFGVTETMTWASDRPIGVIDHPRPATDGSGCQLPVPGEGTTQVSCWSQGPGGDRASGVVLAAPGASTMSVRMTEHFKGERQAVAFGLITARVRLSKQVSGRIDPADVFDLAIAASGSTVASASTGSSTAASTGEQIVIPSGEVTLSESPGSGSTRLASYRQQ